MGISLVEAKSLRYGTILFHTVNKNADGTPQRWVVNGKPRTWKKNPNRVEIPLKHGLRTCGVLTQDDLNLVTWRNNNGKKEC
jgi:hypothetical protein